MEKRPLSVSIIGWYLIAVGVLGAVSVLAMRNNPMMQRMYEHSPLPISAHIGIGVIGSIITAVCGYAMLKGHNWSRFVYVGWCVIGFVISLATVPFTSLLLLGLAFLAVIVFFLFRPDANAWFRRSVEASG